MPDDEPTRLLPLAGQPPPAAEKDRATAATPLPPEAPAPQGWVVVLSSIAVVVGLVGMLTVFISTRGSDQPTTVTGQLAMPFPTVPAESGAAADPVNTAPVTVTSATQSARRSPATTATSRPRGSGLPLTVGATVGLEVAGKPGLRLRYRQPVVRVDQLSPASSAADRAESRFVVRRGLGSGGCVSFEAADDPDFYLRRFFTDLVLHKRDGSPVFDQEATFCPQPTVDGKAFILVVRFPAGFVVVASPDGLLHLDAPDLTNRTAFVVRKPL